MTMYKDDEIVQESPFSENKEGFIAILVIFGLIATAVVAGTMFDNSVNKSSEQKYEKDNVDAQNAFNASHLFKKLNKHQIANLRRLNKSYVR